MNVALNRFTNRLINILNEHYQVPVRYRYYAEKIANGPIVKKFGYNDPIFKEGLLPRLRSFRRVPQPIYRPKNPWSPERALKGQNDYIDILGGGKIKPININYDIPIYMRGKKGNEFQLLLEKRKYLANTGFETDYPTKWEEINKRINYLYKYLNFKTKYGFNK